MVLGANLKTVKSAEMRELIEDNKVGLRGVREKGGEGRVGQGEKVETEFEGLSEEEVLERIREIERRKEEERQKKLQFGEARNWRELKQVIKEIRGHKEYFYGEI